MNTQPKATGKKFSNVNDLVKATAKDSAFKKAFDKDFQAKKIVRMLAAARAAKGFTQGQLAKKIGCGQPRISKIENGNDSQLRIQDLSDYARVLDFQLGMNINSKSENAVEEIKSLAFETKRRLDQLADLATKDEKILDGVSKFFGEYVFNMLDLFEKSASKLPKNKQKDLIDIFTDINVTTDKQNRTTALKG